MPKKIVYKAGVVVSRKSEKGVEVLLVSSRKHKGSWVFPVGTVEEHETLQVTAARECEEESGYIVEVGEEIGSVKTEENDKINLFTFFGAKIIDKVDIYEKDRERIWVQTTDLKDKISDIFKPVAEIFLNATPENCKFN